MLHTWRERYWLELRLGWSLVCLLPVTWLVWFSHPNWLLLAFCNGVQLWFNWQTWLLWRHQLRGHIWTN